MSDHNNGLVNLAPLYVCECPCVCVWLTPISAEENQFINNPSKCRDKQKRNSAKTLQQLVQRLQVLLTQISLLLDSYFQIEKSKNKCIGISKKKLKNSSSALANFKIKSKPIQGCSAYGGLCNAAYAQSATFSSLLSLWLNCCCLWSVRPATRYTEEAPPKRRTRVCALATGQQAVFSLARTAREEASQKLSQPKLSFSVFRTHATICCFTTTTTTTTTTLTSSKYFRHLFLEKIFEFSSTFFRELLLSLSLCYCSLSIWPSQICL